VENFFTVAIALIATIGTPATTKESRVTAIAAITVLIISRQNGRGVCLTVEINRAGVQDGKACDIYLLSHLGKLMTALVSNYQLNNFQSFVNIEEDHVL